jgi:hypothetical protein
MLDIGMRRELFIDNLLIDQMDGANLKLHTPRSGGVAIRFGASEGDVDSHRSGYTTVIKDDDTYRLYYRGRGYERTPRGFESLTCYAESTDGVHWTKPDFGLVEVDGSRHNNVILADGWQFSPFLDTRAGVPSEERYKGNARHEGGLKGYVSADGIHWTESTGDVMVPNALSNHFDTQSTMFWSEAEGCYVLYARHNEGGKRSTARSTSPDFAVWSEQTPMSYSDTGTTTPSEHLYTNQTHPYFRAPHIYISLPARIFFDRRTLTPEELEFAEREFDPQGGQPKDCSDGVLLTSRAGTTQYDFTFMESFIRPGIGASNWTSRDNYPTLGVVQTGPSEMSLFVNRDYGQRTAYLERMTLRLDGFSSLNAPYAGGKMITRPFVFAGDELTINYATSAAGSIRVELQDEAGVPIPGYGAQDCRELIGDEIERVVAWNGGSAVGALSGKTVRLRFVMRDADVYSFRFGQGQATAGA